MIWSIGSEHCPHVLHSHVQMIRSNPVDLDTADAVVIGVTILPEEETLASRILARAIRRILNAQPDMNSWPTFK